MLLPLMVLEFLIYCKEKTKYIEILPYTWINVIYWIYAEYTNIKYGVYLTGDKDKEMNGYTDYDINDFEKFLIESGF